MQKIYKSTPNSVHIPETLPEDLDAYDITHPGRPDDAGIDMPGGVEGWLTRLGLLGNSGVSDLESDSDNNISISRNGSEVNIVLDELMNPNTVHIYNLNGTLVYRMSNKISYSFPAPEKALYLLSMVYGADNKRFNKKIAL